MADISKIRVKGIEYDIKDPRVGNIQIFDADELPEASEDYIEQILRVDGKLYQCVLKEVNAWIPLEDDSEILEDGTKYRTKTTVTENNQSTEEEQKPHYEFDKLKFEENFKIEKLTQLLVNELESITK